MKGQRKEGTGLKGKPVLCNFEFSQVEKLKDFVKKFIFLVSWLRGIYIIKKLKFLIIHILKLFLKSVNRVCFMDF